MARYKSSKARKTGRVSSGKCDKLRNAATIRTCAADLCNYSYLCRRGILNCAAARRCLTRVHPMRSMLRNSLKATLTTTCCMCPCEGAALQYWDVFFDFDEASGLSGYVGRAAINMLDSYSLLLLCN
jgi:hypothetical protein